MGVGGCRPLCPWYLPVLLTLLATTKGFLCVVNSLDLFIGQHIGIDGGGFERLVSQQLLGSLNVAGNRLYQNSECMSGVVKRDILLNTHLLGYPFEGGIHISLGRKMKDEIIFSFGWHPRQGGIADWYGIESLGLLLDYYKRVRFLVPFDVAPPQSLDVADAKPC